ncbi:MAG: CRISPR-associated helicase Cas3' [Candidatus Hydrogenedentes bacterium]|nr:CRISPR-associated helicase Cas3' [Candidatus Hydrogenedentota bacterium]
MSLHDEYYAHSKEGCTPESGWQPLQEHLQGVAEKAGLYAALFGSEDWAKTAAWLHDFGKSDPAFQAYLLRENGLDDTGYDETGRGRINHSSAGAALSIEKLGQHVGKVLAYLVAGHHAGLPDWHSSDTGNAALSLRLREGEDNLNHIREKADMVHFSLDESTRPPCWANSENFHLWMRMLYSCLVDADYLDTEAFMNGNLAGERAQFPALDVLKASFDAYMTEKVRNAATTPVNEIRQHILTACRERAKEPPGLFSLTVPTGGGKTLSGMAFALEHAIRHGKTRIIYVIPYTSIIEQTARELKRIFGDESVVEHHSNLNPEVETQRSILAAENWDAPIIVTTNVQFFESLYAAKPGRCRKIHNLVNSVVILDEAQLLPPNLLKPCVDVINLLTRYFKVTLLLATATQPSLPGLDTTVEIMPDTASLYSSLKRTNILFPDNLNNSTTWEEIAADLCRHEQVLCIVNTRKDCLTLYNLLPEGAIHLSALMCGEHRSLVIDDIKRQLQAEKPVKVVSTQLVEAGVDMDFPVVYRALSGLDSIAQAAGRCNREGKLNEQGRLGEVHVFVPPTPAPRGLLRKGEDTSRSLFASLGFDMDAPDIFQRYFSLFYARVNDLGNEYYEWLVRDVNPGIALHFRTAAEHFRLIDDRAYRPVLVQYGGNEKLLNTLRIIGPKRDVMRKLQRYTVNVPVSMAHRLASDGIFEEIYMGIFAQAFPSLYDDKTGLNIYASNPDPEDLCI